MTSSVRRFRGGQLPLHASDMLKRDLHIDAEDVWDIAGDPHSVPGRLFTNLEASPHYWRDKTSTISSHPCSIHPKRNNQLYN